MIGVVITGHGQFASGLVTSLSLIGGEFPNVAAVDFTAADSPENLMVRLKEAVGCFESCERVAFFTDVAGGSPFKCSAIVGQATADFRVFAGTNLPMLLEFLFARETGDLSQLEEQVVTAGKNAVSCISRATTGCGAKRRKPMDGKGI